MSGEDDLLWLDIMGEFGRLGDLLEKLIVVSTPPRFSYLYEGTVESISTADFQMIIKLPDSLAEWTLQNRSGADTLDIAFDKGGTYSIALGPGGSISQRSRPDALYGRRQLGGGAAIEVRIMYWTYYRDTGPDNPKNFVEVHNKWQRLDD